MNDIRLLIAGTLSSIVYRANIEKRISRNVTQTFCRET